MIRVEKGDVELDLAGYWEFAFSNWITDTNPKLTTDELLSLKGYVGEQISRFTQPNDMAEALQVFTKQTARGERFLKKERFDSAKILNTNRILGLIRKTFQHFFVRSLSNASSRL